MKAFKLMRKKDDTFRSLFINRANGYKIGKWISAGCFPTKKFAVRKGWHCVLKPTVPHLKRNLANGEKRVWVEVEAKNCKSYKVPESHGGTWILAQKIKILGEVND